MQNREASQNRHIGEVPWHSLSTQSRSILKWKAISVSNCKLLLTMF